jgi:7-cyano-7-deazaguanine synthase in queuosine biosynthesis
MKIVVKDPKTVVLWSGGVDSTGVMVNGLNVKFAKLVLV